MKIHRGFEFTVWGGLLATLLTCTGAARAQNACPVCKPAPAGITNWWPGDFNGNDLLTTNAGTATNVSYTAGQVQNAFTFAGDGDVEFGANVGNFGTSDFTLAFWVKSSAIGAQALLENRPSCFGGQFWSLRATNQITAEIDDGTTDFAIVGNANITDGNYHHVALVRSGRALTIYVDGQLDATSTGTKRLNLGSPGVFHAGSSVCTGLDGTQNLTGQLDEIQVYNKALTPTQISGLFNAGHLGNCK